MLNRGHFTRDEWNHLLRLFNIMNLSMFSSSYFLSIKQPNTMSKRAQERRTEEEEPVVAKSKPASLVSRNMSAKQPTLVGFGCFMQPRESRVGSELCVHENWEIGAGQSPTPNSEFSRVAEMITRFQALGDQCKRWVSVQALGDWCVESRTNLQRRSWTTKILKSPTIDTLRKSSQNVRPKLNRCEDDQIFLISKKQCFDMAIVHVNNDECGSTSWTKLQWELCLASTTPLSKSSRDVVRHHAEVDLGPESRDSECLRDWVAIYSLDEIYFVIWQKNQVGESKSRQEHSEADERWKDHTQYFQHSNEHKVTFGITGEPIEVEWNIFPRHRTLQILQEIQDNMAACQTSPGEFEDRIIFMSMLNDIVRIEKRNSEKGSRVTQEGSSLDIGHSSVPKKKKNCMEHTMTNLKESAILLPMSR